MANELAREWWTAGIKQGGWAELPPAVTILSEHQRRRFSGRGLYRRLRRATSWDGDVHMVITFAAAPTAAQHNALHRLDLLCKTFDLLGLRLDAHPARQRLVWSWAGRTVGCAWDRHRPRERGYCFYAENRADTLRALAALVRAPGPPLVVRSDRGNKLAWN